MSIDYSSNFIFGQEQTAFLSSKLPPVKIDIGTSDDSSGQMMISFDDQGALLLKNQLS